MVTLYQRFKLYCYNPREVGLCLLVRYRLHCHYTARTLYSNKQSPHLGFNINSSHKYHSQLIPQLSPHQHPPRLTLPLSPQHPHNNLYKPQAHAQHPWTCVHKLEHHNLTYHHNNKTLTLSTVISETAWATDT